MGLLGRPGRGVYGTVVRLLLIGCRLNWNRMTFEIPAEIMDT